jgi:hypothetical protein
MTSGLQKHVGVLAIILAITATPNLRAHQTTWTTLSPKDEGFSIEVPGKASPTQKPGYYVYTADEWAFFVQVSPVTEAVREFVGASDRGPIKQYLDTIHKGFLKKATERSSSDADFAGYPSIRFSADGESDQKELFEGKYWLVVTEEHQYTLMAIGPRGSSSTTADRFLGSFRLLKPAAPRTPAPSSGRSPLAAKLIAPMLAVAVFTIEEELSARIDEFVQNAPPAQRLGSRWTPTLPAFQQARAAITKRIATIAEAYDLTGEMDRTFNAAVAASAPGSRADGIVSALDGPAGAAILRDNAVVEFASTVMARDPNGPKAGERAWMERLNALARKFDERLGARLPRDRSHEADAATFLATDTGEALRSLWSAAVGKATSQISGAINLMMFDDRDAIMREIEAAVATVK